MSERELIPQKVEIARAIYDGWVSGNVGSALEFLDPEVVWEAIADAPDAGVYRGHAGVRLYMEDWLEDFEIHSMDFEDVIDARDRLVVVQCGRATGKGSGVTTELRYAAAYSFRDGRIVGIKEFRTKGEALEAAGLPKEEAPSRTSAG
jgi:ketosteroid isomerase-like protein